MAKKTHQDLYRDVPKNPRKKLSISLPMPPSVNHMYINLKGGGKILTKKAEQYVRESRALINLAIEEQRWTKDRDHVWYYADLVFFMPDRRIRDSHNTLKLLMDVMNGIVFKDDYYCMPRIQGVEFDNTNPRVEVRMIKQCQGDRNNALAIANNY